MESNSAQQMIFPVIKNQLVITIQTCLAQGIFLKKRKKDKISIL